MSTNWSCCFCSNLRPKMGDRYTELLLSHPFAVGSQGFGAHGQCLEEALNISGAIPTEPEPCAICHLTAQKMSDLDVRLTEPGDGGSVAYVRMHTRCLAALLDDGFTIELEPTDGDPVRREDD